jgi:hypothetical protein
MYPAVSRSCSARSLARYCDVLGFELAYELKEYGWCELKTPFGFTVGLGQTETVTPGSLVPTFGVRDSTRQSRTCGSTA